VVEGPAIESPVVESPASEPRLDLPLPAEGVPLDEPEPPIESRVALKDR
jgi:hypothetical protein